MAKQIRPDILYEDSELIVCRKPAFVAVETAKTGQNDLVSALKTARVKKKEPPYIGVVHRLDQPVEGVMVFAKTKHAAADLSAQIARHRMKKEYMAVVCIPDGSHAEVILDQLHAEISDRPHAARNCGWNRLRDDLLRDAGTNTSRVVPAGTPGAKEAKLDYRVLEYNAKKDRALVQIRLETGRHHQIRVQFAHAGMPLYGDAKYGGPASPDNRCPVALCSCRLGFWHPVTKKWMDFSIDGELSLKEFLC